MASCSSPFLAERRRWPIGLLPLLGRQLSSTSLAASELERGLRTRAQAAPLSQAEQDELSALLKRSFGQDPSSAAAVLVKSITETGKKDLISALVKQSERPGLSRCARVFWEPARLGV